MKLQTVLLLQLSSVVMELVPLLLPILLECLLTIFKETEILDCLMAADIADLVAVDTPSQPTLTEITEQPYLTLANGRGMYF